MANTELRAELRAMTDEQLRKNHSDASHAITRGMLMSRTGVNACLRFMREIEKEQSRRKKAGNG